MLDHVGRRATVVFNRNQWVLPLTGPPFHPREVAVAAPHFRRYARSNYPNGLQTSPHPQQKISRPPAV